MPNDRPSTSSRTAPGGDARRKDQRQNRILAVSGAVMILVVLVGAGYLLMNHRSAELAVPVPPSAASTSSRAVSPSGETPRDPVATSATTEPPSSSARPAKTATPKPSKTPTPAGSTAVSRALAEKNLPSGDEMEWQQTGDWIVNDTITGMGSDPISSCLPGDPTPPAKAQQMLRRNYTLPDVGYATAVAVKFADASAADRAFAAWSSDAAACQSTLTESGFTKVKQVRTFGVDIPEGISGNFYETAYRPPDQDPTYESVGLALAGDRVLFLSMIALTPDSNWSYGDGKNSQLPLHPMFRTLPKAAERLTY